MIFLPIALLGLLLLEELLHRLNRGSFLKDIDLAGESVESLERDRRNVLTRVLGWLRTFQLILFGAVFAYTAARTGVRIMDTPAGQLAALLILIQVARILNRKVVNQWAVLGVTVMIQGLLLIIIILIDPVVPRDAAAVTGLQGGWLISLASFAVLFMLSVTAPFAGTYYLRLAAREGSGFYYFMPPLIYSEYWVRRLTRITAFLALALLVLVAILVTVFAHPPASTLIHMLTVILVLPALLLFGNRFRLHHPLAVSLVLLAWLLRLGWLVAAALMPGNAIFC